MTDHESARARAADAAFLGEAVTVEGDAFRWPEPVVVYLTPRTPDTHGADNWRDLAACAGTDPSLFFAERDNATTTNPAAIAICQTCPVIDECLAEALEYPIKEDHGIRGGTTRNQRIKIRQQRGAA